MTDFEIMQKMAHEDMDIACSPPDNFKRANTGKDGFGEVVMAVGNCQIQALAAGNYLPILYLVNKAEYEAIKASPSS